MPLPPCPTTSWECQPLNFLRNLNLVGTGCKWSSACIQWKMLFVFCLWPFFKAYCAASSLSPAGTTSSQGLMWGCCCTSCHIIRIATVKCQERLFLPRDQISGFHHSDIRHKVFIQRDKWLLILYKQVDFWNLLTAETERPISENQRSSHWPQLCHTQLLKTAQTSSV